MTPAHPGRRPSLPRVGVVVVAYGAEPDLRKCLESIRASADVEVDLVLVNNGCTNDRLVEIAADTAATIVFSGGNRGFAGGCNDGVAALDRPEGIALVNSDAFVRPECLARLFGGLDPEVAVTAASVRLADSPDSVNTVGNPVHFTGTSWAGGLGEPAKAHPTSRLVASASGATMMVRNDVWTALGGLSELYFTYLEDTEFSLRCWLLGLRVLYVPEAISLHRYAFSRNPRKRYFLERNRLLMLLTLYQWRTLLLLAPALIFWELCVVVGAANQGWARQKLAGWGWLLTHAAEVRAHRQVVQSTRRHGDDVLLAQMESKITPSGLPLPKPIALVNQLLSGYWTMLRWGSGRRTGSTPTTAQP